MASWSLNERTILAAKQRRMALTYFAHRKWFVFPHRSGAGSYSPLREQNFFKDTEKGKVSNISSWLILEAGE